MPLKALPATKPRSGWPTVVYVATSGKTYGAKVEELSTRPTAPAAPVATAFATGGTIGASVVTSYRITVIKKGVESLVSAAGGVTVSAGTTNRVEVSWTPITGAEAYRVYGRTAAAELLMATVDAGTTLFNDTGAITPAGAQPSALGAGAASLRIPSRVSGIGPSRLLTGILAATAEGQTNRYYYRTQ